jgi:hypothetical protein
VNTRTILPLRCRLAFPCAFILGFVAVAIAAPDDFYAAHLQPGVKMGMSQEELAKARPAARSADMSGFDRPAGAKPPGPPAVMAELRRAPNGGSVSGYRFKGGKLVAVTEATKLGTKLATVPIEQAQAAADKIAGELNASFVLKGQEQIARSGGVDGATLLTAQLWEDKTNGLHLYFVATNQEIEIVLFDPKAFSKADFFAAPERLENLKAEMQKIQRQLGDHADPPMPLIDLLAKPAAEKK